MKDELLIKFGREYSTIEDTYTQSLNFDIWYYSSIGLLPDYKQWLLWQPLITKDKWSH